MPVRVDRWGPFVFVNLDADAPPLRDVLGAIPDEVARAGYDVDACASSSAATTSSSATGRSTSTTTSRATTSRSRIPELFKELDYDAYRVESPLLLEAARPDPGAEAGRGARRRPPLPPPAGGRGVGALLLVFPNTMFNIYPDNMSSNVILPLGPDRTLTDLRVVLRRARERRGLGVDAADHRVL